MTTENPSRLAPALCRALAGEVLELPWGRIVWSASHSLGNSSTMTFGRVTIAPNQANQIHRHPNCDEILHLVTGRIEHSLGEAVAVMEPGDTISIPAGVWHNARALDGAAADMVIAFSSANRATESKGDVA
jgi:quercetin dioxygenase-like cupin family protein